MSPTDDDLLDRLVAAADLDALVRLAHERADGGDWAGLHLLRDRCRFAFHESGRQLWPAASAAEYRIALEAPAVWTATVLGEDAGWLAPGPLAEVAAVGHSWDELAGLVPAGPRRAIVANERVLRGEDLRRADDVDPDVLGLSLVLEPWEPRYALAEYEPRRWAFPAPPAPAAPLEVVDLPAAGLVLPDDRGASALRDLVTPWVTESNGRVDVAAVEGDALAALAALGPPAARLARLSVAEAMAHLAWAGASGGAHGRRRGAAAGRFGAWWAVAVLTGADDDWPLPGDEVGELAHELRWWWWDAFEPAVGWRLHVVVEDPVDGLAWVIAAQDAAD